jgi:FkbM family methyltransferase
MNYAAIDRVAIGKFYREKYTDTVPIRGVVHVGANDGYEVQWYQELGIEVLCVEPLEEAFARFSSKNQNVQCLHLALGNFDGTAQFRVIADDGSGSSVLPEKEEHRWNVRDIKLVQVARWAGLETVNRTTYNACVIDVQGLELDVLRGMDDHINDFDYFVIECSAVPIYKGEAFADEVVAYMSRMGFDQITPICPHDDVLFVKKGIAPATQVLTPPSKRPVGTKLNVGSGQRPFAQEYGWINCDINPRWNPDLVCDWRDLHIFDDNSMDLVVSHHSLEHVGCGEGDGFIREAHRVLKPRGSLIVSVPDMKKLAQLWLSNELDEQVYMTNVYGAYMGDESDRHRWGYSPQGLVDYLRRACQWHDVHAFNYRSIPGADIARDDRWILTLECIK